MNWTSLEFALTNKFHRLAKFDWFEINPVSSFEVPNIRDSFTGININAEVPIMIPGGKHSTSLIVIVVRIHGIVPVLKEGSPSTRHFMNFGRLYRTRLNTKLLFLRKSRELALQF